MNTTLCYNNKLQWYLQKVKMKKQINIRGAPRSYQRQLAQPEEDALDCYVMDRWPWRTAALRNGLDISDFVP